MDCLVPVGPTPAATSVTASGGSGLALTGSTVDVVVLCAVAAVLLTAGVLTLVQARRRRRQRGSTLCGASATLVAIVGVILALGTVAPTSAARADTAEACDAITVSNVQIDTDSLIDGTIQLLPGATPVTIHASVANTTNVPVALTASVQTDLTVPLASHLVWKTDNAGIAYESTIADDTSHPLGALNAGETATISFAMSLPESLGNEFQGQTFPVSLLVAAIQQAR